MSSSVIVLPSMVVAAFESRGGTSGPALGMYIGDLSIGL